MSTTMRITNFDVTTVALPMRGAIHHSDGELAPTQVRHIVRLYTDVGIVGLGDATPRVDAALLRRGLSSLVGVDPFHLEEIGLRLGSQKFYRMSAASLAAAVQMACLDIQGKALGRPVADVLGGVLRNRVPVIAYIFRKRGLDGVPSVTSPETVVEEAHRLRDTYGFRTLKYKAGAVPPAEDIETTRALRKAFPEDLLRVDPNAAWSVATAIRVGDTLRELSLEWMEDPTLGIAGMSEFGRRVPIATATNMCCIQPREFASTVVARAVNVMLLDLWYLGGPWSARQMANTCQTFDIGVGIHAGGGSAETGIGYAAEIQLAAALPSLVHAIDTMNTELLDDVVVDGTWQYEDGNVVVPSRPGLGVELDEEKLRHYGARYDELVAQAPLSETKPDVAFPAYPRY